MNNLKAERTLTAEKRVTRDRLKLWFFRDLSSEQRLKLFGLMGMPIDEIWHTHGHQKIAFDSTLQSLSTQQSMGEAMPPQGLDRETLGRKVREAWVFWAKDQPDPKPTWLVSYDDLSDADKEADRMIGEAIAKWALLCAKSDGTTRRTMGEPVAWRWRSPNFQDGWWQFTDVEPTNPQSHLEFQPLYALHPNQESGE